MKRHEANSDGRALLNKQSSVGNILTRVAAALLGLSIAYVSARWLTVALTDDPTVNVVQLTVELGVFLACATIALTITSVVPIRNDLVQIHQLVEDNEIQLRDSNQGQRFLRRVQDAFDMAEHEEELFEITAVALRDASDSPGEVLVADSSNAHVQRLAIAQGHEMPGCSVATPRGCPAVRTGKRMKFSAPNDLAACPRLRERHLPDNMVAVCVPINVLGAPSAVLHAVRDSDEMTESDLAETADALEGVAVRFGARLGLLRAMTQSQLQADTDPLTGLLNRRAMENQVREARLDHSDFAVVMADLDHFKDLNDTFGHDTGDRALRLFARVMKTSVRDADMVSRHGGEEFVIVLPGADVVTAAPVMHRLRERLAEALADAQLPTFTVSLGIVDSSSGDDLSELLGLADRALMQAKADGRDRVVIWDQSLPATSEPRRMAAEHDATSVSAGATSR